MAKKDRTKILNGLESDTTKEHDTAVSAATGQVDKRTTSLVSMTKAEKARLTGKAKEHGLSLSAFFRLATDEYMKNHDWQERKCDFMSDLVDLKSHSVSVALNLLLKDRTTKKNIIFATDEYDGIDFTIPITKKILFGNTFDVRPRVSKSVKEQSMRTQKKAEVFTPSWICNKMNNHCDTEWFGCKNVFNIERNHEWIPTEDKIEFPKEKSWKNYVDSKRLEITCGEAPYLVSRYDAATGEIIPIHKRIGILDRKMRIINENTQTRKTWSHWVYRAFESVYGYEYQGDNLLIARINLLETFCEYTRDRWNEEPTDSSLKRIAGIISWNLWQMDGIHGVIPSKGSTYEHKGKNKLPQMTMLEIMEIANESESEPKTVDCKIYDWREDKSLTYKNMREGYGHEI